MEMAPNLHQALSIVAAAIMIGLFITPFVFYPLKVYLSERRRVSALLRAQIREYREAAERVGSPYHMARLGAALVEAGQYEEAIEWLRKALDKDPTSKEARFHLARAYLETGQPREAAELLEPLVREEPTFQYGEAALAYARAVEESLGPRAARAAYDLLLRYYRNHPEGTYRYAMLLAEEGRIDEARELLQEMVRAVESGPSFQRSRQRQWLRRARQWLRLHPARPDQART